MTDAQRARFGRRALSARARILGWVLLLTMTGLVGAGTAVSVVEATRIENRADRNIAQEFDEINQLMRGRNPRTGRDFSSTGQLLRVALRQNVPEEHEVLIGFVEGQARFASADVGFNLARHQPFLTALTSMPEGRFRTVQTPDGEVRFGVRQVVRKEVPGAYVVAYFTDPLRGEFVDVIRTYAVVALVTLIVIGAGGWVVAGRLLRPIRQLDTTARQITETDLTRRLSVTGNDDVSALARTFNAMLDRLESAFMTQREFLDDAGHELATPITIVTGHLELLDEHNPDEVNGIRDLLLDEMDRMGRLVADLILLAKAERPDFLRMTECDVAALTDAALTKASALGDRRWQLDARANGTVVADGQRLTQALMQLAANAVRYGSPGDEIAIGSAFERETLRVWVRDAGPGISASEVGQIFERFRRGTNRAGTDGSGLGLSIVKAIAEAHGGTVELASRPGEGATFTIRVPARPGSTAVSDYGMLAAARP